MQCPASINVILTHKMQVRQKSTIQGLPTKIGVPKRVNRARAVQMALLLVKITSRSPNFLENISFARKWYIKLQVSGREPAYSICLGCLAQPILNKEPLQFPLRETKEQKEV